MQAHSQELIEDYRKAIDQIIALRARVAELERELRLIREHYNLTIKIG